MRIYATRHRKGITLIQSQAGGYSSGTSPQTTSAVGFSSNTTAGSLLVCVAYTTSAAGTPTVANPPTTSGFTWTLAKNALSSAGHHGVYVWYIANASSMATSTTTTVTGANLGNSLYVEFDLYEFGGVAASSPLDTTENTNNGTGTNPATGTNLTTAGTDLIIVAACGTASSNGTAGTNFTLGINASHISNAAAGQFQYILNQVSGSIATSFAGGAYTTGEWGCAAAAFLPA